MNSGGVVEAIPGGRRSGYARAHPGRADQFVRGHGNAVSDVRQALRRLPPDSVRTTGGDWLRGRAASLKELRLPGVALILERERKPELGDLRPEVLGLAEIPDGGTKSETREADRDSTAEIPADRDSA